jgi:pimeloyl-ACP methyl ester carboxylesterase
MVEANPTSGYQMLHELKADASQSNQLAVFVHGWRMPVSTWYEFSDTMFKRLYWQGYQGGFASIFWPTRSTDTDIHPFDFITYNRSEHIAFKSATGTAAYLNNMRDRFPDYTIGLCAHSMGNIVMVEALKQLAAANQAPINNMVLMQAAIPAQCYDPSITNSERLVALDQLVPTPNTYSNYATGITNALRNGGQIINFFNPSDFALNIWVDNQGFYLSGTNGPVTIKPNTFFGYYTDGANSLLRTNELNTLFQSILYGGYYNGPTRTISDPHEIMPFVSRPRSLAVGALEGVHGVVSSELNLQTQLGFTVETYDHSGEFNRNIQDSVVAGFYPELKINLFPPPSQ